MGIEEPICTCGGGEGLAGRTLGEKRVDREIERLGSGGFAEETGEWGIFDEESKMVGGRGRDVEVW